MSGEIFSMEKKMISRGLRITACRLGITCPTHQSRYNPNYPVPPYTYYNIVLKFYSIEFHGGLLIFVVSGGQGCVQSFIRHNNTDCYRLPLQHLADEQAK